jgi:hypothetical protein
MKLVCELYRKIHNSTKIYGICSRQYSQITTVTTTKRLTSNNFLNEQNKTHLFDTHKLFLGLSSHATSLKNNENTNVTNGNEDWYGAGMFIVVVICFYSLSIVFLTLFNIRFKLVFGRSYGICCCRESTEDHHYESQKEETKNTIHMIFRDSSKLLPALAITNSYILTAAFNEKLNAIQKNQQDEAKSLATNMTKPNDIDTNELTSLTKILDSTNSEDKNNVQN